MTDGEPTLIPEGRRAMLLRRLGQLTVGDLRKLDAAVARLVEERRDRDLEKGFFFVWWDGPRLRGPQEDELNLLFSDVVIAIGAGLSDLDVERMAARFAPKPSLLDGLTRLFMRPSPKRQAQDAAITLIEEACAPTDPRRGIVATWNMACAVALRGHLPPATTERLEAAWRLAVGDPPA